MYLYHIRVMYICKYIYTYTYLHVERSVKLTMKEDHVMEFHECVYIYTRYKLKYH